MQRARRRPETDEGRSASDESSVGSRVWDVFTGGVAGAVATAVMSTFRMPVSRSLPPTAWFWSEYVGEGAPREHLGAVFGLHLLYGVSAGAAFGGLFGPYLQGRDVTQERRGTVLGLVYGIGLSQFGVSVVLKRLLGMDLDPDERFVFHVGHVVFGVTLGTLFGSYE